MSLRGTALLALALAACLLVGATARTITIQNRQFHINGAPFFIRGMAYRPRPIGAKHMTAEGWYGSGLCSTKLTAFGEWRSACYDDDFFDGSASTLDRLPPGPASWFSALWDRDFPILTAMHVNLLRIYSMNPLTRIASRRMVANSPGEIKQPLGKDHRHFMAAAEAAGLYVMAPLVPRVADLQRSLIEVEQMLANVVEELGNSDALFSYVVGSSWDMGTPANVVSLKAAVLYVREAQARLHGRFVPITHCFGSDVPTHEIARIATEAGLDYVCLNDGWDSSAKIREHMRSPDFAGLDLPIVFGEFGMHDVNPRQDLTPETVARRRSWFNHMWYAIVSSHGFGCAGGVFFEYQDQAARREDDPCTQCGVVVLSPEVVDSFSSEHPNVFLTDNVLPKTDLYNAIVSGSLMEGAAVNYATDVGESFRWADVADIWIEQIGNPEKPPSAATPVLPSSVPAANQLKPVRPSATAVHALASAGAGATGRGLASAALAVAMTAVSVVAVA